MRLYIAGKMSGVPRCNFPAFDAAASDLRARGWDVICPTELDDEEIRAAAMASEDGGPINGHTWGDFLSRDVKVVADEVQGIVFLPGWESSRGARLEACVGLMCGHQFFSYPSMKPIPARNVAMVIHTRWGG